MQSESVKATLSRLRGKGCDNELRSETVYINDEEDQDRDCRQWWRSDRAIVWDLLTEYRIFETHGMCMLYSRCQSTSSLSMTVLLSTIS